jgi:UDP-N-acetylglucosamine transferase subunit ALG13
LFVTVGSMLPFDRLIDAMDAWSAAHPQAEVFAQIGNGTHLPRSMRYERLLTPQAFRERVSASDLIVAHAGMGTVMSALEAGRPLVVLPRRPEAREVTSLHQVATARWLAAHPGIHVADDATRLGAAIDDALAGSGTPALAGGTRDGLVAALRDFIAAG